MLAGVGGAGAGRRGAGCTGATPCTQHQRYGRTAPARGRPIGGGAIAGDSGRRLWRFATTTILPNLGSGITFPACCSIFSSRNPLPSGVVCMNPVIFQFGPFSLHWYGVFIVGGAVLATWLVSRYAPRMDHESPDHVWNMLAWALDLRYHRRPALSCLQHAGQWHWLRLLRRESHRDYQFLEWWLSRAGHLRRSAWAVFWRSGSTAVINKLDARCTTWISWRPMCCLRRPSGVWATWSTRNSTARRRMCRGPSTSTPTFPAKCPPACRCSCSRVAPVICSPSTRKRWTGLPPTAFHPTFLL